MATEYRVDHQGHTTNSFGSVGPFRSRRLAEQAAAALAARADVRDVEIRSYEVDEASDSDD